MYKQELAFEVLCKQLVGLIVVVVSIEQALPLFSPIVLIVSVVMIAGFGDTYFEEIRIPEHRGSRGISSTGVTPNSRPIDINPRIAPGELFDPGNLIR